MAPFELYGNKVTFNIESVLLKNIESSLYYNNYVKDQMDFMQTVDEIYERVDHLEPWMSGNARGPSTAFCLLYHLFTLKPTDEDIKHLINHRDSPYIRAIGFLLLRYACDPKQLWGWVARHLKDGEKIKPSPEGHEVTMGDFIRDILLVHNYFETLFPRAPEPILRQWRAQLEEMGLPSKGVGNGGTGGPDRRGEEGNRRPASVKASLAVSFGQRAPNRRNAVEPAGEHRAAGGRGAADRAYADLDQDGGERERGRGRKADRFEVRSRSPPRGADRGAPRPRSRSRSPRRRGADRFEVRGRSASRERERERDGGYRRRSRSRSRDRDVYRRRSRSRSRERGGRRY